MHRTLLAGALAIFCAATASLLLVEHPPHHRAHIVAADAPGPPQTEAPTTTLTIAPTTTAPPISTPPPPSTTVTTAVRRVVQRPARVAEAPRPVSPPPADPSGCLYGWKAMQRIEDKIARAHPCWDHLVQSYAWDTSTAFSVLMCESEGDPYDVNSSSNATGLMQILGGPKDPAANIALAYDMYSHRGWQPWVSSGSCWRGKRKG